MDGHVLVRIDRPQPVDGTADHIEHPPQTGIADRHLDGFARILDRHTPNETVCGIHTNRTNNPIAQVLSHFHNQVVLFIADRRIGYPQGRIDQWQLAFGKLDVYDVTDNLCDPPGIDYFFCHPLNLPYIVY